VLAGAGVAGAIAAVVLRPDDARLAAVQDWPPFVLVAGLLLIGLVADGDGLFAYAGAQLARIARTGLLLYIGAVVIIAAVTSVLNLDTSVAFLTPVLVYTARSRAGGAQSLPVDNRAVRSGSVDNASPIWDYPKSDSPRSGGLTPAKPPTAAMPAAGAALLYACLMLSNAGSLLLPGSNLTNLIVLGHLRLTGGQFVARMWLPWLAALIVTAVVIAVGERRSLADGAGPADRASSAEPTRPVLGVGLVAVLAATVLVVTLSNPALPVAAVGVLAAGIRVAQRRESPGQVRDVLGVPVLVGLLGVAVALGTLGRAWSGPATILSHLGGWATAGVAGAAAVVLNNLPAASLLAARTPDHPFSLLIGLNIGPNLCVTGSLAWLLWLRAARGAGAAPSLARATRLGAVGVPLAMAAALGALALTGAR
jgi:arsenical pump membrane protein